MNIPKRGRPRLVDASGLSRADIVAATIRMAHQRHDADINMRELATMLGVSPKLLYRHVGSKDELLDLAAGSILETLELPSPDAPWHERLTLIMRATRALARRYPTLAQPMLLRNIEARDSPEVAEVVAAIKSCLTDAGLSSAQSDDVFFLYIALIQGELAMTQAVSNGTLSAARIESPEVLDKKFETGLGYVIAGMMANPAAIPKTTQNKRAVPKNKTER